MMVSTYERVSSKITGVTEKVRRTTGVTPLGATLSSPKKL